jgi:hypothetical protein
VRVANGKQLRVGPGDEVVIRAALGDATLGRLYVFARERGDVELSPYVAHLNELTMTGGDGMPRMMSTISLRLVEARPTREVSFVSDIDGFIQVMEEIDTADAPRAKVRVKRIVCRNLPWPKRMLRLLTGLSLPRMGALRRRTAASAA